MFQRLDITTTTAPPKGTSNPATMELLNEKIRCRNDRNNPIVATETSARKQRLIKKPVNAVKIAAPAARVALTGSIVSFLPLGSYTAMFSILAMSFASSRLQSQVVGGAIAFVHAGGLSGFEGKVLALLSFISFSAAFDILDGPLHAIYKSSIHDIGIVQDTLTAICVSMFFELLVLFSAIFFALHRIFTNAPRFSATSWRRRLSIGTLESRRRLLVQELNYLHGIESFADEDSDSLGLGIGLGVRWDARLRAYQDSVSHFSSGNSNCEASREEWFKDRETFDDACDAEAQRGRCAEDAERRTQALFNDVNRLIDDCDGLDTAQWDEAIAVLNEPQGGDVVEDEWLHLDRPLATFGGESDIITRQL